MTIFAHFCNKILKCVPVWWSWYVALRLCYDVGYSWLTAVSLTTSYPSDFFGDLELTSKINWVRTDTNQQKLNFEIFKNFQKFHFSPQNIFAFEAVLLSWNLEFSKNIKILKSWIPSKSDVPFSWIFTLSAIFTKCHFCGFQGIFVLRVNIGRG